MSPTFVFQSRDLCFDNVYSIFSELKQWLLKHKEKELVIDFSLVKYIDSAGVAMLIELKKVAQYQNSKTIQLMISPAIKQLVSFYSVEKMLD
jgi:anti-anti-sigma regulatory factor